MLEQLKERVCKANKQLKESGLVILTWGNVSAIDRETNLIVIKPSGVSYEELTPEKMVVVDLNGKVVEGDLNPSSDTPTHIVLYQAYPEIGGVVHTHSRYATVWAQAGLDIIAYGTTHADYFYGDVPCTMQMTAEQIAENYEENTGYAITDTFARRRLSPVEMQACLVAQHGPFTWGSSPEKAVENAIVLEEVAHMAVFNSNFQFGLTRITEELLDKHYLRKHGENAYYGQSFGKVTELGGSNEKAPTNDEEFKIMPSEHTIELKNMSHIGEVVPPVVHHKPPKKEEAVFKAADIAFNSSDDDSVMDASFELQPSVPDEAGEPLVPEEPTVFTDAWGEPIRQADLAEISKPAPNAPEEPENDEGSFDPFASQQPSATAPKPFAPPPPAPAPKPFAPPPPPPASAPAPAPEKREGGIRSSFFARLAAPKKSQQKNDTGFTMSTPPPEPVPSFPKSEPRPTPPPAFTSSSVKAPDPISKTTELHMDEKKPDVTPEDQVASMNTTTGFGMPKKDIQITPYPDFPMNETKSDVKPEDQVASMNNTTGFGYPKRFAPGEQPEFPISDPVSEKQEELVISEKNEEKAETPAPVFDSGLPGKPVSGELPLEFPRNAPASTPAPVSAPEPASEPETPEQPLDFTF